jgi:hypothetical protein
MASLSGAPTRKAFRRLLVIICAATLASVGSPGRAAWAVPRSSGLSGQWYLIRDRAVAAQAELPANLMPVRVAVIDSGIDGGHPALAGRIAAARSFVGGSPLTDQNGHGTFVAGEIVAVGDAAMGAESARVRLVIAKVVTPSQTIDLDKEAEAIRWAVSEGARVINLSLGGVRDPLDPSLDTYSRVEAEAVRYAIGRGAVVVAAAGNGTESPSSPWNYADWPAALPHVLGVGAVGPYGGVPPFSNRDSRFVDLAAPGLDLVSTLPRALTSDRPSCPNQGYSECGGSEYRPAEGTSFAAPQVSAAAALLLSVEPDLSPDQVSWVLERSADDARAATGCPICRPGRDALTGWGTLDIARAVAMLARPIPPADPCATSNDAGPEACLLAGTSGSIDGDLDYWDHPIDVYRLRLMAGQRLAAYLQGSKTGIRLVLWPPGTHHVPGATGERPTQLPAAAGAGTLHYQVPTTGWYDLEAEMTETRASTFSLVFVASPARARLVGVRRGEYSRAI